MALDPSLLAALLGRHPARRLEFNALLDGLLAGVAAKRINVSRDGDLHLFGYSSFCQFEQQWDFFSLIARGLILDVAERRVVATPFPKFFNFNEGGFSIPNEPFEISEKMDGSLGILFHHQGNWRVSTRGQLNSLQGEWATTHLRQHVNMVPLQPGTTYLVEIIYRENRIVIPYDFEGLVLLAAYKENGDELSRESLQATANAIGLRMAGRRSFDSFDSLLEVARTLTRHEEGFVARFENGLRLKIKGEAYCRVHKLICGCTPLALWEAMAHGEDLVIMRKELPEEMKADFDSIRGLLQIRFDALVAEIQAGHERLSIYGNKELGLLLQDPATTLTEAERKFAFTCRKPEFFKLLHQKGEYREKLFQLMRPAHNRLPGYIPSNAMTRFGDEMS